MMLARDVTEPLLSGLFFSAWTESNRLLLAADEVEHDDVIRCDIDRTAFAMNFDVLRPYRHIEFLCLFQHLIMNLLFCIEACGGKFCDRHQAVLKLIEGHVNGDYHPSQIEQHY